jgi:hypothetical protein
MKLPNFEKMNDIISEWYGDDNYVNEVIDDHVMTKDEIVEKAAIDMIHGYLVTAALESIGELRKVGADISWIKSLLDDAFHNVESDVKIELEEQSN